jgi:transcriptional regulator GlxA family with amidase domain
MPNSTDVATGGSRGDPRVSAAISAVYAAPAKRWTASALAPIAGVSAGHLQHLFRRHLGRPVRRCVRDVRLHLAAELLARTTDDVRQIVYRVGMNDLRHFRAAFTTRYGMPPRAFRASRAEAPSVRPHVSPP